MCGMGNMESKRGHMGKRNQEKWILGQKRKESRDKSRKREGRD